MELTSKPAFESQPNDFELMHNPGFEIARLSNSEQALKIAQESNLELTCILPAFEISELSDLELMCKPFLGTPCRHH